MTDADPFDRDAYWRRTLRRTITLLLVWVAAGPLMGIVFVDAVNRVSIGDVPLGFWMAQQGAIYVFVILIFLNSWLSDRQDREFGVHETAETTRRSEAVHG